MNINVFYTACIVRSSFG